MRTAAVALAAATLALSACKDQSPPPPVQLTVWNHLVVPVDLSGDGSTHTIAGEDFDVITIPASLRSMTVVPDNMQYSSGADIPDDLGDATASIPSGATELNIVNVVGGQTYFAPRVVNTTSVPVEIAIVQGTTVQCIATMSANSNAQFGYYLLLGATQVRAYQASSGCTGPYRFWSTTTLGALEDDSGYIGLSLTTAP